MKKIVSLIIIFNLLFLPVYGTDYYLSNTGNDGAAGTIGVPWATIDKLNATWTSGDSAYFNRGDTWTIAQGGDGVYIDFDSTSGNPTVVGAYGSGALPIITAIANTGDGERNTGPANVPVFMDGNSGEYVTIEYLDVRGALDKLTIGGYVDNGDRREYITVQNCTISGAGFDGEGMLNIHGNHISVIDNYFNNSAENVFSIGAEISDCDFALVSGNRFDKLVGQGGAIRTVHMDRAMVEGNWINGANNNAPTGSTGESHWAIVMRDPNDNSLSGGDYNTARNNLVDLSNTTPSDCNSNDRCNHGLITWNNTGDTGVPLYVTNNTFIGMGGSGVRMEEPNEGEITNNIFQGFVSRGVEGSSSLSGEFILKNNNWYGCNVYYTEDVEGTITDSGGSQSGNPNLVDVPTSADTDFKLTVGSIAINAGTSGTQVPTTDYFGDTRTGNPDIGADEYTASAVETSKSFSGGSYNKR